jgi:2-oxoglutarate dehydrogenase E1 component
MTSESPADRLTRASNDILEATTFLQGANAAFIESLYARYQANPDAVDPSWRAYFASLNEQSLSPSQLGRGPNWRRDARPDLASGEIIGALTGQWPRKTGAQASEADSSAAALDSIRAIQMVRAYRVIGHLEADLDPLRLSPRTPHPQLDPVFYGFHE